MRWSLDDSLEFSQQNKNLKGIHKLLKKTLTYGINLWVYSFQLIVLNLILLLGTKGISIYPKVSAISYASLKKEKRYNS